MFGQSILGGLSLLKNPQVLILLLFLILLNMAYLIAIRLATGLKESEGAAAPGCLTNIVEILLQGFTMGVFVLLLMPLMLGFSNHISWETIQSFVLLAARAGIIAVIIITLLSFVPTVGKFLAASPGLEAFFVGVIIFRLTAPLFIEKMLNEKPHILFPNFWESLAYLILALIFTKLIMILVALLRLPLINFPKIDSFLLRILGPSLDIAGGVLALLMFANYVKLSLPLTPNP